MNIAEEWRAIDGHDGYEVSNFGRVRSIERVVLRKTRWGGVARAKLVGRLLVPAINKGYFQLSLGKNTKRQVHQLVSSAFIGAQPAQSHVNHINGIKTDNRVCNLEYVTPLENIRHAIKHGLTKQNGSASVNSKLTEADVIDMRASRGSKTMKQLASEHGVSAAAVCNAVNGKTWKHLTLVH